MPEIHAKDLRVTAPRRWSDELDGILWLPRMIDKARSAAKNTLGDYLYGESPTDRGLLRALGIDYGDFTQMVREAGDDDERVLELLKERCPDRLDFGRRWGQRFAHRYGFYLFLIDLDDGYYQGPLQAIRSLIRLFSGLFAKYIRYRWPAQGKMIGVEIAAQYAGAKAEDARGAPAEPYRWLNAQSLDFGWKMLLSVVLIFLILSYVINFLARIGVIALIIIAAIFLAYLIYPIVRWLNHKLPLLWSILIVYAAIIAGIAVGFSYLVPAAAGEFQLLTKQWPKIYATIQSFINNPHNKYLDKLPPFIRSAVAKLPSHIIDWVKTHGFQTAGHAISVLVGIGAAIGAIIVIFVLAAYLLFDSENIKRFFMGFVPSKERSSSLTLLAELEHVIGGFIRGQIMVAASVGTLIGAGLYFIHEPYAIIIGVFAGIIDLIPFVGPFIAGIPATIIGFVDGGLREGILVIVVFVVANQIEGHILSPNIISRTIQLTPSAVVIAILVGGELFGIIGLFLAVPVAGIIRVLLLHVIPGSVSREEARPVLTAGPHDSTPGASGGPPGSPPVGESPE